MKMSFITSGPCAHWKGLAEALLMSTHNILFHRRKETKHVSGKTGDQDQQ